MRLRVRLQLLEQTQPEVKCVSTLQLHLPLLTHFSDSPDVKQMLISMAALALDSAEAPWEFSAARRRELENGDLNRNAYALYSSPALCLCFWAIIPPARPASFLVTFLKKKKKKSKELLQNNKTKQQTKKKKPPKNCSAGPMPRQNKLEPKSEIIHVSPSEIPQRSP